MRNELRKMRTRPVLSEKTTHSASVSEDSGSNATVHMEKRPSVYANAAIVSTDDAGHLHIGNTVFDTDGALPLIGEPFEITPSPIFYMTRPQSSVVALGEILGIEIAER